MKPLINVVKYFVWSLFTIYSTSVNGDKEYTYCTHVQCTVYSVTVHRVKQPKSYVDHMSNMRVLEMESEKISRDISLTVLSYEKWIKCTWHVSNGTHTYTLKAGFCGFRN